MNPRYINGKLPCKGRQKMSAAEGYHIRKAAKADPDCPPLTMVQLKKMKPGWMRRSRRTKFHLSRMVGIRSVRNMIRKCSA